MSDSLSTKVVTTSSYEIHFGRNILDQVAEFILKNYSAQKVLLIVDQHVSKLHHAPIEEAFSSSFRNVFKYIIPRGEQSKSMEQYGSIVDLILKEQIDRNTALVAIGGGVTGDLAGFVAASVLRGIPLIHVPTTLLSMVDSSIGGKTGVNHITGKNLIGAFYQPAAVFADVEFLTTLEEKEWINGCSEIIKYGFIEDPEILNTTVKLMKTLDSPDPESWVPLIRRSAEIKVNIVEEDALEKGKRAFLNFGHTYAHVVEQKGNYEHYSHGEAVFAGMYGALFYSDALGNDVSPGLLEPFRTYYSFSLENLGDSVSELSQAMLRDKKSEDQNIRLILVHEPGKPFVHTVEDRNILDDSWNFVLEQFST